jgi:signal transduction histidine kinase
VRPATLSQGRTIVRVPRILGVDDNPRNLSILRRALGAGFEFLPANSGEEALELAARSAPDIVLLDIMMPGIDGYETCRRLRQTAAGADAKIILVSAKAMASERLAGYDAGADDYVTKPFDPDELLAKVRVYSRLRSVEQLDRVKSDLLALLGHETRTPLSTILMPISLLRESEGLKPEQLEMLDMMERGAKRLLALVEKCSYLSQIKVGSLPCTLVPSDVVVQAKRAIERVSRRAEPAAVRFELEAPPTAPAALDPLEFASVLDILFDNALRFSPRGGRVRVRVTADRHAVALTVRDEGPGVDPRFRAQLFDTFFSGDVAHHARGTGMGLAIAQGIMQLHQGTLSLAEDAGPGAEFRLTLPAVEQVRAAA